MTDPAGGPASRSLRFLAIGPGLADAASEVLGTVRALADAGHRVTCIQDPRFRDVVERAGARFLPDEPLAHQPGLHLEDPYLAAAMRIFAAALRAGGHDALIYEDVCFYGKTLADAMGVPAIRLCAGFAPSRTILADMAAVNTRRGAGRPYRDGPGARLLSWQARRRNLIKADDILTESLENLPAASFVFTTASFQMRPETLEKGQFHFVGPSVAQRAEREEGQGLISFDELKHPIVHLSLGPLATQRGPAGQESGGRRRLRRTARLYRTCIEAFADRQAGVLACIGPGGDASRLGSLPANVRVYENAPELTVLRHADLFITGGAMGAVNEAMYYGVPSIVIPMADDRPAIAARLTELGLGAMVPPWELSPQIVRRQAATLLDDVGVRLLLNRMSRQMRSARGAGRAAREIVALVRGLQTVTARDGARGARPERVA